MKLQESLEVNLLTSLLIPHIHLISILSNNFLHPNIYIHIPSAIIYSNQIPSIPTNAKILSSQSKTKKRLFSSNWP